MRPALSAGLFYRAAARGVSRCLSCGRSRVLIPSLFRKSVRFALRRAGRSAVSIQRQDFAKTRRYTNRSSAAPPSTLLTACNAPQRVSRRPARADPLSSVGFNNCLLVGRITVSVNGMTEPTKLPAMTSPERRPGAIAAQFWKHLLTSSPASKGTSSDLWQRGWFANTCSHPDSR